MSEVTEPGDLDPSETREWLESIDSVLRVAGPARAHFLIDRVVEHARHSDRDPGEALKNFRRVADVFAGGLRDLIARCEGHPAYEEIYGRPRVS